MTHLDQFFIIIENGVFVCKCFFDIDFPVTVRQCKPWLSGCKSCIFTVIPLHRGSGIVTALVPDCLFELFFGNAFSIFHQFFVCISHFDIFILIKRKMDICHTDFLTLVHIRCSLHSMKNGCIRFRTFPAVSGIISPAGNNPRLIMIFKIQSIPSLAAEFVLPVGHDTFQFSQVKWF